MPSFAVITPTIGSSTLSQCIQSLQNQDCMHYIVVDGREYNPKVNEILSNPLIHHFDKIKIIFLEQNVGKGWYGHRVYAASSFLVNEDYITYLDEDNFVEPTYIEAFKAILNKHEWAYTLRNVVEEDGSFVCQDNCESLGQWPVAFQQSRYHIDTGCFAVPRTLAVKVGHNWYGQWGADRQFFTALKSASSNFGCTRQYTLNYRLGGPTSRATKEMFLQGNQISEQRYGGAYPWLGQTPKQTTSNQNPKILTFNTVTNQFS